MTKRIPEKKNPDEYPTVPDSEAKPTKYNEPALPIKKDQVPPSNFQLSDTRADLRLQIEMMLQRKEAASEDEWTKLGPDVRTLLVEMIDDDGIRSQEAIFQRLISVIGLLSIKRGIAPLSAILSDSSEKDITRAYAANALGRIGDSAGIKALVASSNAEDDMIRRQVAIALGRVDREVVIPTLLKLSEDKSVAVAEVAEEAIERWQKKLGMQLITTPKHSQSKASKDVQPVKGRISSVNKS
jgi:hypothetical protein